jgi:hypothetical protein
VTWLAAAAPNHGRRQTAIVQAACAPASAMHADRAKLLIDNIHFGSISNKSIQEEPIFGFSDSR